MQFRHSAVTQVFHDRIVEAASRLPRDIHPALLGSGEIAIAVDATGLQGLNAWMNQMPDTQSIMHPDHSTNWNLYLHRDQAISQHHGQQGQEYFRLMPCGWLDYLLDIDGWEYDAEAIAESATDWRRTFSPKTGIITTSFRLEEVDIALEVGLAPDRVELDIAVAMRSVDRQPHELAFTLRVHQTLRDGRPLASGGLETVVEPHLICRTWQATDSTSTAKLLAPIAVNWAIVPDPVAEFAPTAEHLAATCRDRASKLACGFRMVSGSDRDGTASLAFVQARAADFRSRGTTAALAEIAAAWNAFFATGAEVWLGEADKEFLFLQAQYVLRAGESFHAGIVLGTFWTETFGGATFFDSLSVCDGMIRCGHVDQVRAFCQWVVDKSPTTGRPFYHMTFYNGQPVGTGEEAFQVGMAYAEACIRLYEYTRDPDDLRLRVEPYLERLCRYLLAEKLECVEGQWRLRGSFAGDGHLPAEELSKYRDMLVWFAVLLAKYVEYADALGLDGDTATHCRAFRDWATAAGPMRWEGPRQGFCYWLPFMLNRTSYCDLASFRQVFVDLFPEAGRPVVDYQPWGNFSTASSAILAGAVDEAHAFMEDGFLAVAGLGYFNESWYEMRGGGFAPYPPASGSFLANVVNFLVDGSNNGDDIRIGTLLPKRWLYHRLRWRNARTVNGAAVSAEYNPYHVALTIDTSRPRRAEIAVPGRIQGEPFVLTVNGIETRRNDADKSVFVDLAPGITSITIARDLATPCQALVVEPMAHGREIVALLRECGYSVRWLRDLPTLKEVIDQPELIFMHTSYASMPVEVARLAERAVRRGARLICLFHSGRLDVDTALAELTGVRARQTSEHWNYDSTPHGYCLTEPGRRQLPDLPETFAIPQTADFVPDLNPDVETLATDGPDGPPVVTRRPLGDGWAAWIAAGNKSADGPQYAFCASTNEIQNHGFDYEQRQQRNWLRDPNWRRLFQALANLRHPGQK